MSSSKLPLDLPKSLDMADLPESIRNPAINTSAQEIFDPWQGKSITVARNASSASPISLTSPNGLSAIGSSATGAVTGFDSAGALTGTRSGSFDILRAKSALESEAAAVGDEETILADETLSAAEKGSRLQKILFASASDGDIDTVRDILGGPAKKFIDIDAKDDSGSTALIYSSCFGNEDVVVELLRYGASVDQPDQCKPVFFSPFFFSVC